MRFFGRSMQDPTKVLNFSTWAPSLVEYFKTGVGFVIPAQLQKQVEMLDIVPGGHNATLPNCLGGQVTSSTNQGNFALTARPFNCTNNEWNVGESKWSVDELNPDITHATLHQVWVRPSVFRRDAFDRSAAVLDGSRLAVMSHPNLTTMYDALTGNGSRDGHRPFLLPFAFNFFSVNYGNNITTGRMHLADNGYIALGTPSAVTSITSASDPGAGLFLGVADRSLLFYGLTPSQTEGGLTYATAVLRFYSLDAGVDEDQVNLEVTFAKNDVNQFIEIRAGSISYDTAGNGTWALSDGHQFLVNNTVMPALYSGQSLVLQSDLQGRYWVPHVNSSLNIREPPAPSTGEGAAQRLLCPAVSPPSSSPPLDLLRARWGARCRSAHVPPLQPLHADRPLPIHPPIHPPTHPPRRYLAHELPGAECDAGCNAPGCGGAPRLCSSARLLACLHRVCMRAPRPAARALTAAAAPAPARGSCPTTTFLLTHAPLPRSLANTRKQARWACPPSSSTRRRRSTCRTSRAAC